MAFRSAFVWLPRRLPHLTLATAAALLSASLLGLSQIAVTRQVIRRASQERLARDARERAATVGHQIDGLRGELSFLARSPALENVETLLAAPDSSEVRWRRVAAEGALLLLMRAHPEVIDIEIRAQESFVRAARRGNVPVVWRSSIAAPAPPAPAQERAIAWSRGLGGDEDPAAGPTLRARLDPEALLLAAVGRLADCDCQILDQSGRALTGSATLAGTDLRVATAPILPSAGWEPDAPWLLKCRQDALAADAAGAPARRASLALGAAGILCSALLAGIGLQEGRRRRLVEARVTAAEKLQNLEHQLLHAERLGTVGRLAAGLAHEINNPLEGMANYLSLARQDLSRGDTSALARHLAAIAHGLDMASAVTRQVLDFAEPTIAPSAPVDLGTLLADVVSFVGGRTEHRSVRFSCYVPPNLRVRGHEVMLRQLFLNLLVNACEAQPHGGEVIVMARAAAGLALVEVADRGPGVPEEARTRIFEPFFTTKSSTGLGLALAHTITLRHGGTLTVEDHAGGGAVFAVSLPQLIASEGTPEAA